MQKPEGAEAEAEADDADDADGAEGAEGVDGSDGVEGAEGAEGADGEEAEDGERSRRRRGGTFVGSIRRNIPSWRRGGESPETRNSTMTLSTNPPSTVYGALSFSSWYTP